MSTSTARRLANQRNAQKSTGPRTEEGKNASKRNALDHGLRSEADIVPPHLVEPIARHIANFHDAYRPEPGQQTWLIGQAANAAARLDYCQFMIRARVNDHMDRADLCWNQDHELAAEDLAARLAKDPARVARRLRQDAHGCRWLINHWRALGQAASDHQQWNDDQINHAFHLLGVTSELRDLHSYLKTDANPDDLADLVSEQLADLQTLLVDALEPLDAKDRELTQMGYPLHPSKELLRLQRYEERLRKVFNESLHQFRLLRAEGFQGQEPLTCLAVDAGPMTLDIEPGAGGRLEPEPELPSTDKGSVASMLASVIESIALNSHQPASFSMTSSLPKPSAPLNRKARRAREKAARKQKSMAR